VNYTVDKGKPFLLSKAYTMVFRIRQASSLPSLPPWASLCILPLTFDVVLQLSSDPLLCTTHSLPSWFLKHTIVTNFIIEDVGSCHTVICRTNFLSEVHIFNVIWTIGVLGFDSRQGLGIFLLTTVSRPALGPTQPPFHWVPGALSLGIKRPGREADH